MIIDYAAALARVLAELEWASVPVEITYDGEFSDGWFFCYESKEFVETGESSAQLMPHPVCGSSFDRSAYV